MNGERTKTLHCHCVLEVGYLTKKTFQRGPPSQCEVKKKRRLNDLVLERENLAHLMQLKNDTIQSELKMITLLNQMLALGRTQLKLDYAIAWS